MFFYLENIFLDAIFMIEILILKYIKLNISSYSLLVFTRWELAK